jgi:hypothetical protein
MEISSGTDPEVHNSELRRCSRRPGRSEETVGCRALSVFTTMFHRYDDFSFGVPFFEIPNGFRRLV